MDPGSGSCYFRHWPSRCQQKTNFLTQFFLLITFWSYIYIIFQRYKVKKSHKIEGIKVFLTIFAWWQKDPDPGGQKTCGSGVSCCGTGSAWIRLFEEAWPGSGSALKRDLKFGDIFFEQSAWRLECRTKCDKKMPGLSTPPKEPIEIIGWNWWNLIPDPIRGDYHNYNCSRTPPMRSYLGHRRSTHKYTQERIQEI